MKSDSNQSLDEYCTGYIKFYNEIIEIWPTKIQTN